MHCPSPLAFRKWSEVSGGVRAVARTKRPGESPGFFVSLEGLEEVTRSGCAESVLVLYGVRGTSPSCGMVTLQRILRHRKSCLWRNPERMFRKRTGNAVTSRLSEIWRPSGVPYLHPETVTGLFRTAGGM